MTKKGRCNFSPWDWIVATLYLSAEERGIFATLLMLAAWHNGVIHRTDAKHLAYACGCTTRKMKEALQSLEDKHFITRLDDKICVHPIKSAG